jgi:hypothetical protein
MPVSCRNACYATPAIAKQDGHREPCVDREGLNLLVTMDAGQGARRAGWYGVLRHGWTGTDVREGGEPCECGASGEDEGHGLALGVEGCDAL